MHHTSGICGNPSQLDAGDQDSIRSSRDNSGLVVLDTCDIISNILRFFFHNLLFRFPAILALKASSNTFLFAKILSSRWRSFRRSNLGCLLGRWALLGHTTGDDPPCGTNFFVSSASFVISCHRSPVKQELETCKAAKKSREAAVQASS